MASKDKISGAAPSDLDIMMFLDGELSSERADAVASYLEAHEEAMAKATSLRQMSELVQASIELDADDAAHKLAGLWSGIESAMQDGATHDRSLEGGASDIGPAKGAAVVSMARRAEDRATDALVRKAREGAGSWFGGWQSHLMTGAFVAVAVAVLMIATRPDPAPRPQTMVRQVVPPIAMSASLSSQDPEVEALEVYEGSGVIMMVPGDDEEGGDNASTVIWISNDTDLVEDPI